ncbi:hypothetical protein FOA52_010202 [Chlamydomonas sp. UWO 241]|nr:hypothetical protein FOA52_010202 [Chlamydomonas sp. UWO 241]
MHHHARGATRGPAQRPACAAARPQVFQARALRTSVQRAPAGVIGPLTQIESLSAEHLAELRGARSFSFDCEGVGLTREGPVCIVTLATESICFVFDVLKSERTPGAVALLKELLKAPGVTKIIHDAKMDVDALHHQLGITPVALHDTQAWDQVLTGNRSNLNTTLERYHCTPIAERSKDLYRGNPVIWATRPLPQSLVDYASGDVTSLLDLAQKQRAKAGEGTPTKTQCVAASKTSGELCKKRMARVLVSDKRRMIGLKGSNLRKLEAKVPGSFFQLRDTTDARTGQRYNVLVYADSKAQLAKAVKLTSPYC